MRYSFIKALHDTSIGKKLVLGNLLVVVLPLLLLYLFISQKLIALSSQQFISASSQAEEQAAGYLSYKLTGMANLSDAAFYDPDKYLMISQNPAVYTLPDQIFDAWRLKNFVNSLKIIDSSIGIQMYVNDDFYYANEEVIFHPLSRVASSQWLKDMITQGKRLVWMLGETVDPAASPAPREKTLSVVRRVIDHQDYDKTVAVLRVDLPIRDIEQLLGKAVSADGGCIWLVNGAGEAFASGSPAGAAVPAQEDMRACLTFSGWQEKRYGNQEYLFSSIPVGETGLYIVDTFPKSAPMRQSDGIRTEFAFIVLAVTAAALAMSLLISRTLTSRLRHVMQRMRLIQQGDLQPMRGDLYNDEIGELTKTYNFMLGRIHQLADERYNLGREAHRHEMSVLQGQINPHFLYNMLDLINLSALDRGVPDVAELARMLARFYRLGLNRGRDTVTIADELEHVSLYFNMQNRRFGERIRFEVNVSEKIKRMRILKIVLQPIVENAVLHGILSERDKSGHVSVTAAESGGYIAFTVADDGMGMPREKLSTLLDREGVGYGLYNVHRRLCIFYGDECGLCIESKEGAGTAVSFRIPVQMAET